MRIIVQKFGGSSIDIGSLYEPNPELIMKAARRVIAVQKKGYQVVVVVSAPGKHTDCLSQAALSVSGGALPSARELDMLLTTGEQISISLFSMALDKLGARAISLTGHQLGIVTDSSHTRAKIKKIKTKNLKRLLEDGYIVVVAGFQGVNKKNITTLGRGGSDLTAVALAFVLGAEHCEIFTDVDGVFTADPRMVPEAKKISRISYEEMLEMASAGARVMQARSLGFAQKYNIVVHVRSSRHNRPGTLIGGEKKMLERVVISGVTYDRNQAKISIVDIPDRPGVAAYLFGALAEKNINVDMIIQSASKNGKNSISFSISRDDLEKTLEAMKKVKGGLKAKQVIADAKIAKVSLVGLGMRTHAGVAAKMFKALAGKKINIEMISTSEIKISCVIREREVKKAVQAIHRKFNLGKQGK